MYIETNLSTIEFILINLNLNPSYVATLRNVHKLRNYIRKHSKLPLLIGLLELRKAFVHIAALRLNLQKGICITASLLKGKLSRKQSLSMTVKKIKFPKKEKLVSDTEFTSKKKFFLNSIPAFEINFFCYAQF